MKRLRVVSWVLAILLWGSFWNHALAASPGLSGKHKSESSTETAALKGLRVVVSSRALQAKGRSHWHLYLYDGQGTLLKQLTKGKGFDNTDPVFSPDGKTIAFKRQPARWQRELADSSGSVYLIARDGTNLSKWSGTTTAPEWYAKATHAEEPPTTTHSVIYLDSSILGGKPDSTHANAACFTDPTGKYDLIADMATFQQKDSYRDIETTGELRVWLRDRGSKQEKLTSSMPGDDADYADYISYLFGTSYLTVVSWGNTPWLSRPPLLTSIFWIHMGSTDGNAYLALDPKKSRWHLLSANGAQLFLLPDMPALLVLSEARYRPIGDGERTANCTSLDLWTSDLERHQLSPDLPVFSGASTFQPERVKLKDAVRVIRMSQ